MDATANPTSSLASAPRFPPGPVLELVFRSLGVIAALVGGAALVYSGARQRAEASR